MIGKLQCMMFSGIFFTSCLASNVVMQEKASTMLHVLPGAGVADPMGKTGFFPNTSGGIDALNLATGKVLWSSKEANLPLITTPSYLFALKGNGNQLRVIKINTRKQGQRLFESPLIPLPDWASVQKTYGRSFRSSVRSDNNGLFLIWEAKSFYAGGAPPVPEVIASTNKYQNGVERIDGETGTIESLDAKQISAGKFFPISAVGDNAKLGALTLMVEDTAANHPTNPLERRRILKAVNEAKQVIWQHDIAPPIELPLMP